MKSLIIFLCVLILSVSEVYSQTLPRLTVRLAEATGEGCFDVTDVRSGTVCFDVLVKVNQNGWNLQSYNIWVRYGLDNTDLSFISETPCYHQQGGAIELDTFGKYRFLSANIGLPLVKNEEKIIQNFCLNIEDFSALNGKLLSAGGQHYGLISSANLVDQNNSSNAVNPFIPRKKIKLKPANLSVLRIETNSELACDNATLELRATAEDESGNFIPDDCEPFTYLWKGPNGFTSTEASPVLNNGSPHIKSGDFYVTVTGANGCEGWDKISFNQFYCNSSQSVEVLQEKSDFVTDIKKEKGALDDLKIESQSKRVAPSVQLFPNPVTDDVAIQMDPKSYNQFILRNNNGTEITRQSIQYGSEIINMSKYPAAVYYITFVGDDHERTERIVKIE